MIRYPKATLDLVCELVDEEVSNWRAEAKARTAAIIAAGAYSEGRPSWSDVKPVFMRLQSNKCAFCEWPLGGEFAGKATQDVEHFRPKNAVKEWPKKPKKGTPPTYPFSTGGKGDGYHWLAYDLGNYAAACKACNTARKSNYFPIAGAARGASGADIATLNALEQPFLIFPLGTVDDDPEDLITFEGIVAKPTRDDDSHERRRATVTIDFFALNSREELWEDRFRVIREVFYALGQAKTAKDDMADAALRTIADAISESGPQASCARSYLRLIEDDPELAWEAYLAAEASVGRERDKRRQKTQGKR
ncbi:HNH endonuclease family protein [Microvirga lotononidis]|uniref:TIGR02646 family protein n=1 Tax=Microvirga lotononidis TaxID=864069 RepID=I4Z2L1_9HYPH|nr:hypothetical protein [Microvirga lotononidis]EIM30453.1 hypothetical protein MicloDRAFT_00007020 [Microvirga lotononidis]WQO26295.1 hypothetical protein U0023_16545 [Microvirga lotononidis]